jgi:hypothetical protein
MTDNFFWSVLAQVTTNLRVSPSKEEKVESRTKKATSVKEILLAQITTDMLEGEQVCIPTAEEAQAREELEPHTLKSVNAAQDKSGPAFDDNNDEEDNLVVAGVKVRNMLKVKLNRLALDKVQLRKLNAGDEDWPGTLLSQVPTKTRDLSAPIRLERIFESQSGTTELCF